VRGALNGKLQRLFTPAHTDEVGLLHAVHDAVVVEENLFGAVIAHLLFFQDQIRLGVEADFAPDAGGGSHLDGVRAAALDGLLAQQVDASFLLLIVEEAVAAIVGRCTGSGLLLPVSVRGPSIASSRHADLPLNASTACVSP
jgi:hypothetical protein